jgi:hypothetical protein
MTGQAAKKIQQLVHDLTQVRLGELSDPSKLTGMLRELRASMAEVAAFSGRLEELLGGIAPGRATGRGAAKRRTAARPPARGKAAGARSASGRRRGRAKGGVGEFAATAFVHQSVKDAAAKGTTAGEVINRVKQAAPGQHVSPSALVHTILRRLEARMAVRR